MEATGQLMDLLEKEGVSIEGFNAKMQTMGTATERANYIASVLAEEGLNDMYEQYVELNPKIVENAEAQLEMQTALADLAKELAPMITEIAKFTTSLIEWANENPVVAKSFAALGVVAGGVATVFNLFGPLIGKIIQVLPNMSGLFTNLATKVLPAVARAFGLLSGPIGWVITALTIAVPIIIKHWDSIKTGIVNIVESIKTIVSKIVQSIYNNTIGRFGDMKDAVAKTFAELKDGMLKPIEMARDAIKTVIDTIKSFFNFKFEWPDLKMPKLSLKPEGWQVGDILKGQIPSVDIKWNAQGGILTRPTIFGASGSTLLGGGEVPGEAEAILPLNKKNLGAIGEAIAATMDLNGSQGDIVVNLTAELDGAVVAKKTARYMNREQYREYEKDKRGG